MTILLNYSSHCKQSMSDFDTIICWSKYILSNILLTANNAMHWFQNNGTKSNNSENAINYLCTQSNKVSQILAVLSGDVNIF